MIPRHCHVKHWPKIAISRSRKTYHRRTRKAWDQIFLFLPQTPVKAKQSFIRPRSKPYHPTRQGTLPAWNQARKTLAPIKKSRWNSAKKLPNPASPSNFKPITQPPTRVPRTCTTITCITITSTYHPKPSTSRTPSGSNKNCRTSAYSGLHGSSEATIEIWSFLQLKPFLTMWANGRQSSDNQGPQRSSLTSSAKLSRT